MFTYATSHPNHSPSKRETQRRIYWGQCWITHLELSHQRLHSQEKPSSRCVGGVLLIKTLLEDREHLVELPRFYDRPGYDVKLARMQFGDEISISLLMHDTLKFEAEPSKT